MSVGISAPANAPGRWMALTLICIGVVGVMTTWFSATAIVPDLTRDWSLGPGQSAWLTNAVQLGFVAGALAASFVNLPDLVRMSRLMAISALVAGLSNLVLIAEPGFALTVVARFVTGAALAGVYPPALKLMATWFVRGRGLALGFLVAALTLGSSMPHLFRAMSGGLDWRAVVLASTAITLGGALLFALTLREGPHAFSRATFNPRQSLQVFRDRPLLLANIGYFGHMWELYAMWAWILAFSTAATEAGLAPTPFGSVSMLSFAVVAVGVVGAILGGVLAERIGRCLTTAGMMAVSGSCAAVIGFAFAGPGWLLAIITLIWGISIIGDSAQFSTAVTEIADQSFVGTALAMQVAIGFALSMLTIWGMPMLASWMGSWQWTFIFLMPGPLVGAWAMLTLRAMPDARKLAGGRR